MISDNKLFEEIKSVPDKKRMVLEKPEIIVNGTADKPYFEIKYRELGEDHYAIGYSSYDLSQCFKYLETVFEIVDKEKEDMMFNNKKTQVSENPIVVVQGTADSPYYGIMYKEVGAGSYSIGYGSPSLHECFADLKTEFEIVDREVIDGFKKLSFAESEEEKLDFANMTSYELYDFCCKNHIKCSKEKAKAKAKERKYYLELLRSHGFIIDDNKKERKDDIENPSHYTQRVFETIDEMLILFGREKVIAFCQLNAWKYRARAQYKDDPESDMAKSDQYLKMVHELQEMEELYPGKRSKLLKMED